MEEWGCNLGEDAFVTEEVQEDMPEALAPHIATGLDEVQGEWELDELVNDLQEEWRHHENNNEDLICSEPTSTKNYSKNINLNINIIILILFLL